MPSPTNRSILAAMHQVLAELEQAQKLIEIERANISAQLTRGQQRQGDYSEAGKVALRQSLTRLYTHTASAEEAIEKLLVLTEELSS